MMRVARSLVLFALLPVFAISDEPTTSKPSACCTSAIALAAVCGATFSPKNTTSGFSRWPLQCGQWESLQNLLPPPNRT